MSRRLLSACMSSLHFLPTARSNGTQSIWHAFKQEQFRSALNAPAHHNDGYSQLWTRGHKQKVDASPDRDRHLKHCWSCDFNVRKGGLVCHSCDKIQPVEKGINYFDLFGLPDSFDLQVEDLEQKYKSLQWQIHPDKAAGRTPKEQLYSSQQAALINHAYSVLRSPLSRGNYLLMLLGASHEDEEERVVPESSLLAQVLELREEIEESSDPQKLQEILDSIRIKEADLVLRLSAAFACQDLKTAKDLVMRLSYVNKLIDAVIEKMP